MSLKKNFYIYISELKHKLLFFFVGQCVSGLDGTVLYSLGYDDYSGHPIPYLLILPGDLTCR